MALKALIFNLLKSKKGVTVIFDACHSGGACETLSAMGSDGGLFIASTGADQLAVESPELGNGLWTATFLKTPNLESLSTSFDSSKSVKK